MFKDVFNGSLQTGIKYVGLLLKTFITFSYIYITMLAELGGEQTP